VKAREIGNLARHSLRVCLKNVVVTEISKEVMKSECKYITMKGVSNIQNLEHTKFHECEQANLIRCEIMKESLKIFSEKLKLLCIRRTYSVDNIVANYLSTRSPFKNLKVLDLSYNQIEYDGFCQLVEEGCIFAHSLQELILEHNIIIASLQEVMSKLQLIKLKVLDLNLNQIDWTEEYIRRQSFKIACKHREKKMVNDQEVKVKAFDIQIDDDLKIKVMCPN
jgi:Leucine-rich repeat (LRR) protein